MIASEPHSGAAGTRCVNVLHPAAATATLTHPSSTEGVGTLVRQADNSSGPFNHLSTTTARMVRAADATELRTTDDMADDRCAKATARSCERP